MNFSTIKSITIPEGNVVKITQGTTVLWGVITEPEKEPIINLIDTAGVTSGKRLSTSSGSERDQSGYFVTGFIPVNKGDVIRTSGGNFNDSSSLGGVFAYKTGNSYWTFSYTMASASPISAAAWDIVIDSNGNLVITVKHDQITAIKLCGKGTGNGLIVTKNQEIE